MDFKQAEKRVEELTRLIRYHNERYYNEDSPEITDFEYDMLLRELEGGITVISQKQYPDMKMGSVFQKTNQILQTVHGYSF